MLRVPLARSSRTFAPVAVLTLLLTALLLPGASNAQSPSAPPSTQTPAASSSPPPQAAKPAPDSSNQEIVSSDVPATFKVNVNLVLVRVVVRDSEGDQMAALNRGVVIP